ncbi:hypothetical protein Dda_5674 [Drechslerella dactyloides]|uniref:Uncharacterized protein n=1 Tax=Drechslerella dactyloides TaxID=74499 RepID=A0AAD6IXX9_DREDA|nr:hypothetical protein Dda_5674 [Drechslerella dactyloides]
MYATRAAVVRWQERTAASSYDTSSRSIALEPIHLKQETVEAQVAVTSKAPRYLISLETLQCLLAIAIEVTAVVCILVFNLVDITLSMPGVLPNDSRALYVFGTTILVTAATAYVVRQIRLQWIFYVEARRLRKADVAQNVNSRRIETLLGFGSYKDYGYYWGTTVTLVFASLSVPAMITALTPSIGFKTFPTTAQLTPGALECTSLSLEPAARSISWRLENGTFINIQHSRSSCLADSALSVLDGISNSRIENNGYAYLLSSAGVTRSSIGVPYNARDRLASFDKIFWNLGTPPKDRSALQESAQCLPVFVRNPARCYRAGKVVAGLNNLTVQLDQNCNVSTPIFGADLQNDGASASGFCTQGRSVGSITYVIGSINSHAGLLASALLDFPAVNSISYAVACDIDISSGIGFRETTISRNYKQPYESFVNRENLKVNAAAEFIISSSERENPSCNKNSFVPIQNPESQSTDVLTAGVLAFGAGMVAPLFMQNRYNDGWWDALSTAVLGRNSSSFLYENSENALEDVLGTITAIGVGQYLGFAITTVVLYLTMLFFKPAIAVALASFSVSSLAQAPQFYIDRLNILTTETKNLIQPANSITVTSGPLAGVGQGPLAVIFDGCEAAIVRLNELLPQMQPDAPIVDPDAKPVAQACESFIDAQIELWTILSGKSWLMIDPFSRSKTALYARTLEGLVDRTEKGLSRDVAAAGEEEYLKIADLATGTRIWLYSIRDELVEHNLKAGLYGYDLFDNQFPPVDKREDVTLDILNILDTAKFRAIGETYHYVHARLLTSVLTVNEWGLAIENCLEILKPGGYLHFEEIPFGELGIEKNGTPVPAGIIEKLQKSFKAMNKDLE